MNTNHTKLDTSEQGEQPSAATVYEPPVVERLELWQLVTQGISVGQG